jgi:hypothetical protein
VLNVLGLIVRGLTSSPFRYSFPPAADYIDRGVDSGGVSDGGGGTRMAMGKRQQRQESLFVTADKLPRSDGHPFYQKLNALLAEAEFDRWIEARCREFYSQEETRGKPSLAPGVYFTMLLVGYFEGLDSQRGIAWRCADSLSLRAFLGVPLDQATPDHSTMSVTRRRLGAEVFDEVFQFVLAIAAKRWASTRRRSKPTRP